jgi:hypothetical protein
MAGDGDDIIARQMVRDELAARAGANETHQILFDACMKEIAPPGSVQLNDKGKAQAAGVCNDVATKLEAQYRAERSAADKPMFATPAELAKDIQNNVKLVFEDPNNARALEALHRDAQFLKSQPQWDKEVQAELEKAAQEERSGRYFASVPSALISDGSITAMSGSFSRKDLILSANADGPTSVTDMTKFLRTFPQHQEPIFWKL